MNKHALRTLAALATLIVVCCRRDQTARMAEASPNLEKEKISQNSISSTSMGSSHSLSPNSLPDKEQTQQEARKHIADEIVRLIGNPKQGLTREHWKILKKRYWRSEFEDIVRQKSDTKTVIELLATPNGGEPLITQIVMGRFTDTDDKSKRESLLAFHMLAVMSAHSSGGGSLPTAFEERRDETDITLGDVLLFEVFNDAYVDVPKGEVTRSDLDQWKFMAKSPNSLHRLLALRTFQRVSPTREQLLEFYRNYVEEPDQGIVEEVARYAYMTALPEAANLLSDIRRRTDVAKNLSFVTKLSDRIADLESRLPLGK